MRTAIAEQLRQQSKPPCDGSVNGNFVASSRAPANQSIVSSFRDGPKDQARNPSHGGGYGFSDVQLHIKARDFVAPRHDGLEANGLLRRFPEHTSIINLTAS
jgi:hypothetical protein